MVATEGSRDQGSGLWMARASRNWTLNGVHLEEMDAGWPIVRGFGQDGLGLKDLDSGVILIRHVGLWMSEGLRIEAPDGLALKYF